MKQTTTLKISDIKRSWYLIDLEKQVLGRAASLSSILLQGKHKPNYAPNLDCGDNIILINASKVKTTGSDLVKKYYNHSGYPGGLRVRTRKEMKEKYPLELVYRTIKGMLPKTRLGRQQFKKLFIYLDANHKQQAQNPIEISSSNFKNFTINK
ncbi:50S ribosomal protein L13 [Mycoplasma sp. SG1]|uniref:50S ribosomal protein L13 n=1 Tax=Mycoplasma sp. SG1 TaxID=2810348 RepID=UPI002024734D|nr:50S ribosomal protein L13 [Mycoplasma sp. SG1]URM52922.1 50S ribosomal protein L13 [Mycoplasma sp. SG1]